MWRGIIAASRQSKWKGGDVREEWWRNASIRFTEQEVQKVYIREQLSSCRTPRCFEGCWTRHITEIHQVRWPLRESCCSDTFGFCCSHGNNQRDHLFYVLWRWLHLLSTLCLWGTSSFIVEIRFSLSPKSSVQSVTFSLSSCVWAVYMHHCVACSNSFPHFFMS